MVLQIVDLVVVGLLYMAYPTGCGYQSTFPAEAKALPHNDGANDSGQSDIVHTCPQTFPDHLSSLVPLAKPARCLQQQPSDTNQEH